MNDSIIHICLMPGLAASPKIFENFSLPEDRFKLHYLEWKIPRENENLQQYAKRMCDEVDYPDPVLLGVSFGGILVQEMSKIIEVKKLFVVSSVKSKYELPNRLNYLKFGSLYKHLPTGLVKNVDWLSRFSLGDTITARVNLYKKYLSVDDPEYLDWAIKEMIFWDQEEPLSNAIYIHGDKDLIFPHSCKGNCIVVEGGTHIMVVNRFRWFNENLPKLIDGNYHGD